jgi:hypothetical protein
MNKVLQCGLAVAATVWLSGCIVAPPPPPPQQDPHVAALRRAEQVEQRIEHESHSIDAHVSQGYYPPPRGYDLHQRLNGIRQQARDMEAQFGGGLSGDEQHTLNEELNGTARLIGE